MPALHQRAGNFGAFLPFLVLHIENVHAMPAPVGAAMFNATKRLAIVLRQALGCEGNTIRQNNEPAGGQDVWHHQDHVVPRYVHDSHHAEPLLPCPLRSGLTWQFRGVPAERDE